jgi:replicative DNA helicase
MAEGTKLLASLVDTHNGLEKYRKFNLIPEYFRGTEANAFTFIANHILAYGVLPSRTTLIEAKIELPAEVSEPPAFYLKQVKDRHIKLSLKTALEAAGKVINDNPSHALGIILEQSLELQRQKNSNKLVDMSKEGFDKIGAEYAKVQKNNLSDIPSGLQLGWPTFDKMCGGIEGGDLVSIIGRPAAGKTYCLLHAVNTAWRNGKIPLVISMEMTPMKIMQRAITMLTHKSITQLKHGKLSSQSQKNMMNYLADMKEQPPYYVVDGNLSATVNDIIVLCKELQPDVVFIDGAYMLRSTNKNAQRWDRQTETAERIKGEIAGELGLPTMISYQFNRTSVKEKKAGPIGVEGIAYTDAIGQLSSIVLGLFKPEGVETIREREIEILKGRDGESGKFAIEWNFDVGPRYMSFDEIVVKQTDQLGWA